MVLVLNEVMPKAMLMESILSLFWRRWNFQEEI
jgi:hypothetical protein